MSKNYNWRKSNFEDYNYSPSENHYKFYKNYFNPKTIKTNNFYNTKTKFYKNFQKNDFFGVKIENTPEFSENVNFQSFYPKNYKKTQKQFINNYNNDEPYEISSTKNNDFSNYENFLNNNNLVKNESLTKNENIQKNQNDEETNKCDNDKIIKNEQYEKRKKMGIKSIPHPKRKKGHGSCYISGKKLLPYQQKKEKENEIIVKKERKLSNSSIQNNFDSAKHSISTLNTSSSSYKDKDKDVSNDDKKSCLSNDIKNSEINNDCDTEKKILINKFDEKNTEIKHYETNPIFENTPILQVNVKLPDNRTVIFQLRRYDDLFFTIKLFCEINSIEEKFIKPIIIKSLCTINTIYQIYNSPLISEDITILKKVKKIADSV